MMKRINQVVGIATCLLLITIVTLSGCGQRGQDMKSQKDLMEGIAPGFVSTDAVLTENGNEAAIDFSVKLFQQSYEPLENTLLAPMSVFYALSMTANGAEGNTLTQMEDVLGMSTEESNNYAYAYRANLKTNDDCKVSIANSVWFMNQEGFTVERDFLQNNANYYGAGIYSVPFDKATMKAMNTWVDENTDGMVKDIIAELPQEAVMYLINTLAFDAQWEEIYEEYSIQQKIFTKEDGTEQIAEMMHSEESKYLEDENTTGFMKSYLECDYAFVALLPNAGITMEEYVTSLSGEKITELMNHMQNVPVKTGMPKFEAEFESGMSGILKSMGMADAFDEEKADFSGIGRYPNNNLFIDEVLHKTYIIVSDKGTKAGAATVVNVGVASEEGEMPEPKKVYLNRPFVYMIIDCKTNVPLFIGTVVDVENE